MNAWNQWNRITFFDSGWEKLTERDRGREGERDREIDIPFWNCLCYRWRRLSESSEEGEDQIEWFEQWRRRFANWARKETIEQNERGTGRSSELGELRKEKINREEEENIGNWAPFFVKLSEWRLIYFFLLISSWSVGRQISNSICF